VKAAAFYEYGPAEAMQYADIPDPDVGLADVLIRVQACGVNRSDLDSRAGTSRWPFESGRCSWSPSKPEPAEPACPSL
jgi:NADPH:quinone reductase-like Zn-dependent oxidoreductase